MERYRLQSIQVGRARTLGQAHASDPLDRRWTSAIFKEPVEGRVWMGGAGLMGDVQVDRRHHGGPDRAILAYAADHYPRWAVELEGVDLKPGAFGENLTVAGITEETVCLGDRLRVGDAVLEVSQPRLPCQNLARKLRVRDMVKRVEHTGRGGWYLRVLNEGWVEAGLAMILVCRPHPEWSVRVATRVYRERRHDPAAARKLAGCPALSSDWKYALTQVAAPA